jgi:hypothetical protein
MGSVEMLSHVFATRATIRTLRAIRPLAEAAGLSRLVRSRHPKERAPVECQTSSLPESTVEKCSDGISAKK